MLTVESVDDISVESVSGRFIPPEISSVWLSEELICVASVPVTVTVPNELLSVEVIEVVSDPDTATVAKDEASIADIWVESVVLFGTSPEISMLLVSDELICV